MPGDSPSLPNDGPTRRPTAVEVWLRHEHLPRSERIDRLTGDAELEPPFVSKGSRAMTGTSSSMSSLSTASESLQVGSATGWS